MRKVIVFSTLTEQKQVIETDVTTWGELKKLVSDFNSDTMKATEGTTKTTLESNEAVLPTGDFKVFLTPSKIKAGGEVRYTPTQIKELRTKLDNVFSDLLDEDSNEDAQEEIPLTEEEILLAEAKAIQASFNS